MNRSRRLVSRARNHYIESEEATRVAMETLVGPESTKYTRILAPPESRWAGKRFHARQPGMVEE
jgi:hypothetical protein